MRFNPVSSKAGVLALVIASSVFLGCVGAPPAIEEGPFADVTPKFAHQAIVGKRVRWAGRITASRIREHESCLEVAAAELDFRARPWLDNATQGTFFVCLSGFYDPAIYRRGRWVTITGTVRAIESSKPGEGSVLRPKVEGTTIYLWPESGRYREWDPGWRDPFWDDNCWAGATRFGDVATTSSLSREEMIVEDCKATAMFSSEIYRRRNSRGPAVETSASEAQ